MPLHSRVDVQEARRMTFQLGFNASDGVLLASDLKHTSLYGYRTSQIAPKIKISKTQKMACCSAGDTDFCFALENIVNRALSDGSAKFTGSPIMVRQLLFDCLRRAQEEDEAYRQKSRLPTTIGGSTIFAFRDGPVVDLWTVRATGQFPEISLVLPGECVKAGDANSPAVFFPERYLEKLPNTVEALIPLAVHTVLMAEGEFVKGVEIGIFTQSAFRVLTGEELAPFLDMSKRLDTTILEEFHKAGKLQ